MRNLILAFAIWAAFAFHGRADNLDRSIEGHDVTVSITSAFSALPPGGCVPYRVTIRNDRNTPGTWHILFQGAGNTGRMGPMVFKRDIMVAPNSSGSFDVLVPLPLTSAKEATSSLNVKVTGPGLDNLNSGFFGYVYTNISGTGSPFTIIGKDVLGPVGLGPLEARYKDDGREFYGSEVDTANLSSDWRAYSGVAAFILKDSEWLGLTATQREAISGYVAQGGHLTLLTSGSPDSVTPGLQLPEPDGKPGPYGFGVISLVSANMDRRRVSTRIFRRGTCAAWSELSRSAEHSFSHLSWCSEAWSARSTSSYSLAAISASVFFGPPR
jgi:hypothetical protein